MAIPRKLIVTHKSDFVEGKLYKHKTCLAKLKVFFENWFWIMFSSLPKLKIKVLKKDRHQHK